MMRLRLSAIWTIVFITMILRDASAQQPAWTDTPPPVYPARIFAIEPANDTDVRVNFFVESGGAFRLLTSTEIDDVPRVVGTGTVSEAGVYEFVDAGALKDTGHRFYSIGVTLPHVPNGLSDQWGLYVQSRESGQRYLVSMPLDAGADPTLQGPMGQQLMYGLGSGTLTHEADELRFMTSPGVWESAFLFKDVDGNMQWRAADMKTPSTLSVRPGHAFWIERRAAPPHVTRRGILAGPVLTDAMIRPVHFRLAGDGITPFGITRLKPLVHRNTETDQKGSTPPNQLGFYTKGSAGATADLRRADERGDQIWVWQDNEWAGRYWLMGHLGEQWDGKWWDPRNNDFAHFMLEPGVGYYYVHITNRWGGADFEWQP